MNTSPSMLVFVPDREMLVCFGRAFSSFNSTALSRVPITNLLAPHLAMGETADPLRLSFNAVKRNPKDAVAGFKGRHYI